MFCSSLRRRKDWATAVPPLLRSSPPGWKESPLNTHDVAFATTRRDGKPAPFRVLLLSSSDLRLPETRDRIDRLCDLTAGRDMAIGLLLPGDGDMTCFIELQMKLIKAPTCVPLVPIASAAELPTWLDQLRRACNAHAVPHPVEELSPVKDLVSRCARGAPLGEQQVKTLMNMASSVGALAQLACDAEGQKQIHRLLGEDGVRVTAFFRSADACQSGR